MGLAEPPLHRCATDDTATGSMWPTFLLAVAVAGLLGAEVIHGAVIRAHMAEWFWAGIFFCAIGLVEGFLAVGLLIAPGRSMYRATAVISLLTVGVWVLGRTFGHPGGLHPWHAEPIGVIDGVCTVFEQITFIAVYQLLRTEGYATARLRRDRAARQVMTAVALVFAIATGWALHNPVHPHVH